MQHIQWTVYFRLVLIFVYVVVWVMARTNLKYVQQTGLGKGKTIEQMKMEKISIMGYKEQAEEHNTDDIESDLDNESDELEEALYNNIEDEEGEEEEEDKKEKREDSCFDVQLKLPCRKIQESVHRFLILRKKSDQYARRELIYTKLPNDIKVSVKSKYEEFKCICEMKYEV